LSGLENVGAFKTQNTAWTAVHAFTTGQAMALLDWYPQPGMPPHIDIDGAIVGAYTALNTAGSIWYDVSLYQGCPAGRFLFK
jgi:hypothetical protein